MDYNDSASVTLITESGGEMAMMLCEARSAQNVARPYSCRLATYFSEELKRNP
jgi:hypothetical protein